MVTLKDIGREAGVSAMTVSNVLRGREVVAPETAERVLSAAQSLGYHVNTTSLSARNLRISSSRADGSHGVIGVAVYEFDNAQPGQMAALISEAAAQRGYRTVFQQTRVNERYERDIISGIANQFCDGLIFSPSCLQPRQIDLLARHRPTVLLDDGRDRLSQDTVLTPCESGARDAVLYLYERGCEHIAIIGGGDEMLHDAEQAKSVGGRRLRGCVEAFKQSGITWESSDLFACEWSDEAVRQLIVAQGKRMLGYDALFCMTDEMALGALRGLADLGIRVPDDIAVMGFDGIRAGALSVPSLTTVEVDYAAMATIAVDLVAERMHAPTPTKEPQRVEVPYRLVVRESA